MAWVPPGVEVKHARALAAGQGRGQARRRPRRARHRRRPLRASSTPPRTSSSSTTRCRSSPTPRRRSRTARRSSTSSSAPTRCYEWSLGGGDLEAGFAEADVDRRAADRQPPHRRRGDRAARRARRLPRRQAHRLQLDAGPALPAPVPGGPCSASARTASASIAPEVGGGFGSKLQIYAEEIGCAWASRKLGRPGQVGRDALGGHDGHPPRARPDRLRQGRRQARRHDHRVPRDDHRRPRRLPDAAHADDPAARARS